MSDIETRNARKLELQRELLLIDIEELIEASMKPDSWYQSNIFKLATEAQPFWRCLSKYIFDCIKPPFKITAPELSGIIYIKVSHYKASLLTETK